MAAQLSRVMNYHPRLLKGKAEAPPLMGGRAKAKPTATTAKHGKAKEPKGKGVGKDGPFWSF